MLTTFNPEIRTSKTPPRIPAEPVARSTGGLFNPETIREGPSAPAGRGASRERERERLKERVANKGIRRYSLGDEAD